VTVITATFNSSRTLRRTIESVLMQDFENFEYLVVGDGCTDDSETVVKSFKDPRVHWHNLPLNSGSQGAPNNHGLRVARGELIAHIGHDDLWFPWHLSTLVRAFDSHDVDWLQSMVASVTPDGLEEIQSGSPDGFSYHSSGSTPSSWLYRRCEPRFSTSENVWLAPDFDFQTHYARQGWRMEAVKELTVVKFPSASWRLYARRDNFPQDEVLEQLRDHAGDVQRRYLSEAAARYFQMRHGIHPMFPWLRKQLRRRILLWVMNNRWSFPWAANLFGRQVRRWNRAARQARGLNSPPKP
jgi:glycosyltransferase involved in cell wall biosynthesis